MQRASPARWPHVISRNVDLCWRISRRVKVRRDVIAGVLEDELPKSRSLNSSSELHQVVPDGVATTKPDERT